MMLNTHAGTYKGFYVVYKNWLFTLLGKIGVLPKWAIVMEISGKGKARRLRVPVGREVANNIAGLRLDTTGARLFKVVRIYV